ncbi:hypothetical protein SLH49_11120 [Cognatiyoonia sp. IB215446]|uniref:hypothetical protein n=1 Tax=Cognatiyoonia sp. IB215446 TaxID=3097355 RepID=UPI002A0C7F9E|nr:hypothetical protein [Cognatiyoonia sp. IB215446]MDX8348539.1 hypothetical protein [Cognatiyoonia sp. IB215446]
MTSQKYLTIIVVLTLAACETVQGPDGQRYLRNVPEGVLSIAAPFQNLEKVVLLEEDNCYWYSHAGPVETTLLPLRTKEGRPICAASPAEVPAS